MTLNEIKSTVAASSGGAGLGFTLKSLRSGKLFKAVEQRTGGKFVIVSVNDAAKEFLVSGDADRYELVAGTGATGPTVAELNNKLSSLQAELDGLATEIDELTAKASDIEDEMVVVGEQLAELGD